MKYHNGFTSVVQTLQSSVETNEISHHSVLLKVEIIIGQRVNELGCSPNARHIRTGAARKSQV
ncbi:hypothetical protein NDK43_14365 [Neobacillus pocheonensis]|uniref:Uncharacterized protein n=1 Tax=Neobacillus pocheonensis TaxID=363869 RepID=A0ABT0WAR7_9BACI|nr:hypothetical protein [Neobacillus pocheonensis]